MAANTSQVGVLVYATTNVTTGAYVALFTSTSIPTARIQILDTSGKILKIAVGPAGSEVDICSTAVSGSVTIPYYIPSGSRVSIKAIDANATTGYNVTSLIPW